MNTPFKKMIKSDIRGVFINRLEFADTHNIDGVPVRCVLDYDIYKERLNVTVNNYVDGVFFDFVTLFVEATDLPVRPVRGQEMFLDGQRHTVEEVDESDGMFEIVLGGHRQ